MHAALYRIADGTLSPLEGPMGLADYRSVLERGAIERNGKLWAWTIPIVLPVTAEEALACAEGAEVALCHDGEVFGKLEVESIHAWDKAELVEAVYGTARMDHPGARLWTSDERETLIGGRVHLVPFVDRLQQIHQNLPLRTVPLEIQLFAPVYHRVGQEAAEALKLQRHAVEAWNAELEDRYSPEERSVPITEISLAG